MLMTIQPILLEQLQGHRHRRPPHPVERIIPVHPIIGLIGISHRTGNVTFDLIAATTRPLHRVQGETPSGTISIGTGHAIIMITTIAKAKVVVEKTDDGTTGLA